LRQNFTPLLTKVGFFSPLAGVGVECGYGYAAVELIKAWQRLGVPVWSFDRDAPVIFNFGQPHYYERIEGKLNIGYSPWESTGVPDAWLENMSHMDEIWTPCQANKEWYQDAGLEVPVRVLPHGVNAEHYPPVKRELPEDGVLKFLHIGEPTPRKGGDVAYRAFKAAFGERSDVLLTLKGRPRFNPYGENVQVISDRYSQEEMRDLYLSHHALVYPTNGEGFGFIPFNGAATCMPTFVTNWSAPLDYMHYCWPIEISALVEPDYEPHIGLWAEPSEISLTYWMKHFTKYPQEYFDIAWDNGNVLQSDWSWDIIGSMALEFMNESLNSMVA
jgi:glycosyltransferase involved in cell wall biosynthesis